MRMADLGDIALHWREDGNPDGAPIVFANSLGTDLRVWDRVVARLPQRYRILRYDMRGHGLSDCPDGPYSMGTMVRDAERLMDHLDVNGAVFVGLSVGGMVAQGLAVKRLDLVRAMVLSNTAAKIGTKEMWEDRIAGVRTGGLESLADSIMEKWFTPAFRSTPECAGWRNMVTRTPVAGYVGTCHAIAGTDFYTPTSGLALPTLAIAGSEDGSTPPDLVRETAELVKGSEFHLIRNAGHIPCVEQPDDYSDRLSKFLTAIGH
ncbi:3-oxoadipate enol-lactonase [Tropicimonas marinistellae]|uniref:3-oxoadipate enol-lactonase n=1 Tax=Tropicimonas marinistellae TaxID=1739787 RepID=UPI00082C9F68|nr:3-oxoadipate enol-lactonase [Tropicimonas marinistellae]